MPLKKAFPVALALALGQAPASTAAAPCSNVEITLHNGSADPIKVTSFQYEDEGSWKSDQLFGADGYQKLEAGMRLTWKRDLPGVGGKSTRLKATYQHYLGGEKWGAEKVVTIGPLVCADNARKTLELNK